VFPAILRAIAPRLSLAVAVGPRSFLFADCAIATVGVDFAVLTDVRQTTARISAGAICVRLASPLGEYVAEFLSRVRLDVFSCAQNFSVRWRDHPLGGKRYECDQRERARVASGHIDDGDDVVRLVSFRARAFEGRVCVRSSSSRRVPTDRESRVQIKKKVSAHVCTFFTSPAKNSSHELSLENNPPRPE